MWFHGGSPSHFLELSVRPFRGRLAGLWGELRQHSPWREGVWSAKDEIEYEAENWIRGLIQSTGPAGAA